MMRPHFSANTRVGVRTPEAFLVVTLGGWHFKTGWRNGDANHPCDLSMRRTAPKVDLTSGMSMSACCRARHRKGASDRSEQLGIVLSIANASRYTLRRVEQCPAVSVKRLSDYFAPRLPVAEPSFCPQARSHTSFPQCYRLRQKGQN
jgi:hypothetical protein